MDDTHFIEAIGASPADHSLRLVYADWLEERGDRRGELIRVEHELRQIPIGWDRYLSLSRRRAELRQQCDSKWLNCMFGGLGASMQQAGALFERLRSLAERPLKAQYDLDEIESIEFPTDQEAHNDALQAAARRALEGMLEMIIARARDFWGEPSYRFTYEDEELPAWASAIPIGFDVLVGWKRPRKVAFALIFHEDREIPIMLLVGVVRASPKVGERGTRRDT
jgi:uncharacterized protein (TIGR02996 family)